MLGRQTPTFEAVGSYAYSNGDMVADMFEEESGANFFESQRYELVLMLARNNDGSPAAQTFAISKPRQNGKSYAARFYAAYAADFEHRSVLFSAHHGTTVRKMFMALLELYDNPDRFPQFAENVKLISRSRGYEGIYFKDWVDNDGSYHPGGCIEFSTRTNSGARGGTYQVIIIDEAQELTDEQQEGMLPVVSAAADVSEANKLPQIIMIGTPTPPTANGTVFRRMHKKAHTEPSRETWWIEWAYVAENIEEAEISENNVLELARETNPAMGKRIAEKTVLNEFVQMSKDGFARERLGWWSKDGGDADYAIKKEKWEACASEEMKPEGKTAYGVKFSPDGAEVSLCGAVCPITGPARISLIEHRDNSHGIQWLADWLNQRQSQAACVVIDGKNGADLLIEKIAPVWKIKNSIVKVSAKDAIAAASQIVNDINEKTVTWYKYQEILNESAITSVKRPISGGWGFGGENSTPIEAAALALWGCRTTKRNPGRKMRIG